jgi:hypothetical protein
MLKVSFLFQLHFSHGKFGTVRYTINMDIKGYCRADESAIKYCVYVLRAIYAVKLSYLCS